MENTEKALMNGTTETKATTRKRLPLGGTVEQSCMAIMALGIAGAMIFKPLWARIAIASVCAVVFLVPIIIRMIRSRSGLDADKVCSILKKRGITPVVDGDEIRWICDGKESVLRIRSSCQVEIAREYDIPPIPAAIKGNEKAALETMKEVYLAKVSVREEDGDNKLAFSTESLCVSAKELSAYIPMCLEILDLAEDRHREHVIEIRDKKEDKPCRRIGFAYEDGEVR